MKSDKVSLGEASRILGKGSRQVRRYVDFGKLPAAGGGHGNPIQFSLRELLAFKARMAGDSSFYRREKWRGLIDADTLARIAHASVLRQENPGKYDFYLEGFTELWRLPADAVSGLLRNCLPKLGAVPDSARRWACRLGAALSPLEMDFVAAMLICRLNPGIKMEESESKALGAALDIVKRARPYLFYNEKTFQQTPEAWAAIEGAIRANVKSEYPVDFVGTAMEIYRERFFGPDRDEAWHLYGDYHPTMHMVGRRFVATSIGNFIAAVHRGDVDEVRRLIFSNELIVDPDKSAGDFPEADELRGTLTALTKKLRILRGRFDRTPSANRVGLVLGLKHRPQGCRSLRRIRDGLDRADLFALFTDYLRCGVPRSLKTAKQVDKDVRPQYSVDERSERVALPASVVPATAPRWIVERCSYCQTIISDDDDVCPECGKLILPSAPKVDKEKETADD